MPTDPGGLRANDRVFVLGSTGDGKSELLNHLTSTLRCQRLILDTKHEFAIPELEPVRDVEAIDWQAPVILYRDRTGEVEEFEELFAACFRRRRLTIIAHELADLCEWQPSKTPRSLKAILSKGRAHAIGLYGGSQRPVEMPKRALTEAEHIFVFVPGMTTEDDHRAAARAMGLSDDELRHHLSTLQAGHGMHSFLWWDKRTRGLTYCPPLTDAQRGKSILRRTTVA